MFSVPYNFKRVEEPFFLGEKKGTKKEMKKKNMKGYHALKFCFF
jgi:hypothetical protein